MSWVILSSEKEVTALNFFWAQLRRCSLPWGKVSLSIWQVREKFPGWKRTSEPSDTLRRRKGKNVRGQSSCCYFSSIQYDSTVNSKIQGRWLHVFFSVFNFSGVHHLFQLNYLSNSSLPSNQIFCISFNSVTSSARNDPFLEWYAHKSKIIYTHPEGPAGRLKKSSVFPKLNLLFKHW